MAPEPAQFVNERKICPRCNNTVGIKFMYLNNNKPDQPRYRCLGQNGCTEFFTLGGKIRAPRVRPQQTSATPTAVAAADRRTGPARRGRPPLSQRVTRQSGTREIQETPAITADRRTGPARQGGPPLSKRVTRQSRAREIQETPATCARTEARAVAAGTLARPATGALRLPRIPMSEQRESPVASPVENPAVQGPVPTTRVAGLLPGDVVDAAQRTASRTAATAIAQAGDVTQIWTKAVLGVSPYGLVPASDGKRMKVLKIKYGGEESFLPFRA